MVLNLNRTCPDVLKKTQLDVFLKNFPLKKTFAAAHYYTNSHTKVAEIYSPGLLRVVQRGIQIFLERIYEMEPMIFKPIFTV